MRYRRIIYHYPHAMEAIGIILILTSIPLLLRWVPRNRVYGFRIPVTLRDDAIWYDANALCGRHMLVLGVLLVSLEFILPVSIRIPILRVIATIGFVGIIIVDWRTANRWARERSSGVKVVRSAAVTDALESDA